MKPERIEELIAHHDMVICGEASQALPSSAELLHLLRCARAVAELERELMPELDGATITTAQPDPRGPGVFRVQISGEATCGEATDLLTATEAALRAAKKEAPDAT